MYKNHASTIFSWDVLPLYGNQYRGAQWLRCCVTNRKAVGSIPAGVIGIFQ